MPLLCASAHSPPLNCSYWFIRITVWSAYLESSHSDSSRLGSYCLDSVHERLCTIEPNPTAQIFRWDVLTAKWYKTLHPHVSTELLSPYFACLWGLFVFSYLRPWTANCVPIHLRRDRCCLNALPNLIKRYVVSNYLLASLVSSTTRHYPYPICAITHAMEL